MSDEQPSADILLQHTGWLKALARRLLRDESRADDVVQRVFLQAIRRPPPSGTMPPAWLAQVARNEARQLLRSERARAVREQRATRVRNAPPTSDVVQRAEILGRVVDAVLSLDEPFRTVVLLRYFDGLEPKEIAGRLELPPGTVRSRLKRGLDRLRQALDRRSGGSREAWVLSLTAFVNPEDVRASADPASDSDRRTPRTRPLRILAVIGVLAGVLGGWALFRAIDPVDGARPTPTIAELSERGVAESPVSEAQLRGTAGQADVADLVDTGPGIDEPAESAHPVPEPPEVQDGEPVPVDLRLRLLRPSGESEEIGIRFVGEEGDVRPWDAVRNEFGGVLARPGQWVTFVPATDEPVFEWIRVTVPDPAPAVLTVNVLAEDDPRFREMLIEVVDEDSGQPLPQAVLEWGMAEDGDPTLRADRHGRIHARAGPGGHHFPGRLILTAALLTIRAPGYHPFPDAERETTAGHLDATALDAWLATGVHRIALTPRGSVRARAEREIRILDAEGRPLAGALFRVTLPLDRSTHASHGQAADDGIRRADRDGVLTVPAEPVVGLELIVWGVRIEAWGLSEEAWPEEGPREIQAPAIALADLAIEGVPGWRPQSWRCDPLGGGPTPETSVALPPRMDEGSRDLLETTGLALRLRPAIAFGSYDVPRARIRLPLVVGRQVTLHLFGESGTRTWTLTPDRAGPWPAATIWTDLPESQE